jgi:hypothetical protein
MRLSLDEALSKRFFKGDGLAFYVAERPELAHYVAGSRGMREYAVLQVWIGGRVLGELQAAGAVFRMHAEVNGYPMGRELVIPATAFPVFNAELAAGGVFLQPAP